MPNQPGYDLGGLRIGLRIHRQGLTPGQILLDLRNDGVNEHRRTVEHQTRLAIRLALFLDLLGPLLPLDDVVYVVLGLFPGILGERLRSLRLVQRQPD